MNINEKWRSLGWRHPLWDYVRFYSVVQGQRKELQERWREKLRNNTMEIDLARSLPVSSKHSELFFDYLESRNEDLKATTDLLRSEEEALAYCDLVGVEVTKTRTKSQDHHQSSAAMVAAVSYIAGEHCLSRGLTFSKAPQRRCVAG